MEPIKTQMTAYWSRRVSSFSDLRQQELHSEKRALWQQELERCPPSAKPLRILDIGTGTGFFALLLAAQGHRVTGIDLTPEMIAEARRTADALHIAAEYLVMDAEEPDFPSGSFDAVVTRNLTWSLPHLGQAYSRWHNLLKPGGILVNFDADYCREKAPDSLPPDHAHKNLSADLVRAYEQMKNDLRPQQLPRPQWDVELLQAACFRDIRVDTGAWKRLYGAVDAFYNPTPIFVISAIA